jgi:hypothetical protein
VTLINFDLQTQGLILLLLRRQPSKQMHQPRKNDDQSLEQKVKAEGDFLGTNVHAESSHLPNILLSSVWFE